MKPNKKTYNQIPPLESVMDVSPLSTKARFFQHFPGIYCQGCGETFALYSYSGHPPDGLDKENKPYYKSCFKCKEKK